MDKNKRELKWLSIIILAFVALAVIRTVVEVCLHGLPKVTEVPEGMTKEIAQVVVIVTWVLSFIVLIPEIYMGIKGLKIATGSASGKAHIVWAVILTIFAIIALISSVSNMIKTFNLDTALDVVRPIINILLFGSYFVYARRIAND